MSQLPKETEQVNPNLLSGALGGLVAALGLNADKVWNVVRFLVHYGWLNKLGTHDAQTVLGAIEAYKKRFGFPTIYQAMAQRRCGFPDHMASEDQGNPWTKAGKSVLTWSIVQVLPGWTLERQVQLTREAFQLWGDVCGLKSSYIPQPSNESPDIAIGLCSRNNGSDGRGGMLAFTYLPNYTPKPVPLLFDVSEIFISGGSPKQGEILYLNTCTHELGHVAIGLDHSPAGDNQLALMDPYYREDLWRPQPYDIKRALVMWPKVEPKPVPPSVPVPEAKYRTHFQNPSVRLTTALPDGTFSIESSLPPTVEGYTLVRKTT